MIDWIDCPLCKVSSPIEEFDWEEGNGMVCPSCDKYFLFDWELLNYTVDDDLVVGEELF